MILTPHPMYHEHLLLLLRVPVLWYIQKPHGRVSLESVVFTVAHGKGSQKRVQHSDGTLSWTPNTVPSLMVLMVKAEARSLSLQDYFQLWLLHATACQNSKCVSYLLMVLLFPYLYIYTDSFPLSKISYGARIPMLEKILPNTIPRIMHSIPLYSTFGKLMYTY